MKPIISAVAIAGMFSLAACNRTALQEKEAALRIQQQQIEMMNLELAKKHVIDSMNEVSRMQYAVSTMPNAATVTPVAQSVSQSPRVIYVRQQPAARTRSYARSTHRTYAANTQPVVYQQAPAKKKGWSAKAKGAVIGGAGGAVAGAIINGRNRPVGALIGGLLGAGAGTGIGAIIDHKNGR